MALLIENKWFDETAKTRGQKALIKSNKMGILRAPYDKEGIINHQEYEGENAMLLLVICYATFTGIVEPERPPPM